ncbi:MAG: DUF4832 domain-containing protein [Deltaproteobacteria bacterium]|nr:DUF4832 domain-containing protein [Deltaproteobacteria bacterium]
MDARFAVAVGLCAWLLVACSGAVGQNGDGGVPDGATGDATGDARGGDAHGADGGGDGAPPDGAEPSLRTVTFTPIDDDLLNPERGFYDWADLTSGDALDYVRQNGLTVAWAEGHLDAYRATAIPSSYLTALGDGLARARAAGIKIVLRFSYNDGPWPNPDPDASKPQILAHLAQLAPALTANADVIAVLQAGFIGAWGEWHSSTNGLDNPTDRHDILLAILDALPASRMAQIRTPMYKADALGGPLADADAFTGTDAARVGHHNDCFLVSDDDAGTYADPIETWKDFVAQEGRFTPVGGETCGLNGTRTECASATAEMARLHWSLLNLRYHQGVIDGWDTGGCTGEIRRRLGYRLELQRAAFSEAVRPGGVLVVEADIANTGWASPFNARPLFVVLDDGTTRRTARLWSVDPRRWEAGATATVHARLRVPADATAGTYRLALWLPDDAASLRDRTEHAIRFASDCTWDATSGANVLATDLPVDPQAPGSVDPNATEFVEIP